MVYTFLPNHCGMRFSVSLLMVLCCLGWGSTDRSFRRSNSGKLLRQNADPMYPLGAFDKVVPSATRSHSLHLGAFETGYPSDNAHLNHHRFAILNRQQAGTSE